MILLFILLLVYSLAVLFVLYKKSNTENQFNKSAENQKVSVEVLIPFRNEEGNIERLIQSIIAQETKFNVLYRFINDHSDDQSEKIVFKYIDNNYPIVFENYKDIYGKKDLLNHAIKISKADVILTTDADCILKKNWVELMTSNLLENNADMIVGQVQINKKNFWGSVQALEFLSIQSITRFLFQIHKPLLANGANLGFKRASFFEVGGYSKHLDIATGDDIYLLKSMKAFNKKICYLDNVNASVLTYPVNTINEFIHQRIRWSSKIKTKFLSFEFILVLFLFTMQVLTILSGILFVETSDLKFLLWIGLKLIVDYFFLSKSAEILSEDFKLTTFIVLFLIYPIYIIWIGLVSRRNKYSWKNRIY